MPPYRLWKVTYRYETPGDYAQNWATDVYLIAARTKEEARRKGDDAFSSAPHDGISAAALENATTAARPYVHTLPVPMLSTTQDQDSFSIDVKASVKNGRIGLEFLLTTKK